MVLNVQLTMGKTIGQSIMSLQLISVNTVTSSGDLQLAVLEISTTSPNYHFYKSLISIKGFSA